VLWHIHHRYDTVPATVSSFTAHGTHTRAVGRSARSRQRGSRWLLYRLLCHTERCAKRSLYVTLWGTPEGPATVRLSVKYIQQAYKFAHTTQKLCSVMECLIGSSVVSECESRVILYHSASSSMRAGLMTSQRGGGGGGEMIMIIIRRVSPAVLLGKCIQGRSGR
jgi:hypothetical protein